MSEPDQTIGPIILKSAKKAFSANGYAKTDSREFPLPAVC